VPFNQRDHVRQHDAGLFVVFVFVFVTFKVQVNVALIQGVAVVVQVAKAGLFVLGFLNVCLWIFGASPMSSSR
jgi:uncharacterized membrane protein